MNNHLTVQLSQYTGTYIYYANLFTTAVYVLAEPILMMALFDMFNQWNPVTLTWFASVWGLSVYSLILLVGSVEI